MLNKHLVQKFSIMLHEYKYTILWNDSPRNVKSSALEIVNIIYGGYNPTGIIFDSNTLKIKDWNIGYILWTYKEVGIPYISGYLDMADNQPPRLKSKFLTDLPISELVPLVYLLMHDKRTEQ